MKNPLTYQNCKILAPMVRMGTLPLRLLSLDYGADIVYCEEIIDYKLVKCKRVVNDLLNTIDYVHTDGECIFRTCRQESDNVVLQMGTSDPTRALMTAKLVENDVAGIDINMGCPKAYSIKGGMGAALLTKPQKIYDILKNLVDNCTKPITCKMRILPELKDTLHLAKIIESTGVAALAVHGRLKVERSKQPVHKDVIKQIAETLSIPVIANGGSLEINCYEDIEKFRQETGTTSVMVARAAQWNPSIFRREGCLPIDEVVKSYIKYAIDYDNKHANTKYCLAQFMHEDLESGKGKMLLKAASLLEISEIWNMDKYYHSVRTKRETLSKSILSKTQHAETNLNRNYSNEAADSKETVYYNDADYDRRAFSSSVTPKSILHEWSKKFGLDPPVFSSEIEPKSKLFHGYAKFNGKQYRSPSRRKNKRSAEQSAAYECVKLLKIEKT